MIDVMLLAPGLKVLPVLALARLAWWVLGDFVLEHVGIPFLDAGWTREAAWATRPATTPERGAAHWRR